MLISLNSILKFMKFIKVNPSKIFIGTSIIYLILGILFFINKQVIDIQFHDTYLVIEVYQLMVFIAFIHFVFAFLYILITNGVNKNWVGLLHSIGTITTIAIWVNLLMDTYYIQPRRYYEFDTFETMRYKNVAIVILFFTFIGLQSIFVVGAGYHWLKKR